MPINIPDQLPAVDVLRDENVFVMTAQRAQRQEVRPLKLLILNLMPKKIETENQLLRLLSNSPLQLDVELLRVDNRISKNTPRQHLERFYRSFDEVKGHNYDGMIITGAPLGLVSFEDVLYWDEIEEIIRWSSKHVTSTLFLCWAAQAGLKVFYDLPKKTRETKLSGVYPHDIVDAKASLTRGFDDHFMAPHSRYADFPVELIEQQPDLKVFVKSDEVGAYLFASQDKRQVYITGHPEYDACTLSDEYIRDTREGLQPSIPANYFPSDDPDQTPQVSWRSHGNLLISNWLNYYVYQITPYDLESGEMTLDD